MNKGERNSKCNYLLKKIFLLLAIIIVIKASQVYAIENDQTASALVECNFSFQDSSFGAWDNMNQRGVFLEIVNMNLAQGYGDFRYYNKKDASRTYWNNYNYTWGVTSIPMIDIDPALPSYVYARCRFRSNLVGNGIYLSSNSPFRAGAPLHQLTILITQDFNLSTGLLNASKNFIQTMPSGIGDFSFSNYTVDTSKAATDFYNQDRILNITRNGINVSINSILLSPGEEYVLTSVFNFTNWDGTANYRVLPGLFITSIASYSTGERLIGNEMMSSHFMNMPAYQNIFRRSPYVMFYVNTTGAKSELNDELKKRLQPRFSLNSVYYSEDGLNEVLIPNANCTSVNSMHPMKLGNYTRYNFTVSNPYLVDLSGFTLRSFYQRWPYIGIGQNYGTSNRNRAEVHGYFYQYGPLNPVPWVTILPVIPAGTTDFKIRLNATYFNKTRPGDYSSIFVSPFSLIVQFYNSIGAFLYQDYHCSGTDGFPLMGIGRVETRIQVDSSNQPILNMTINLPVIGNTSALNIAPGDYRINVTIYDKEFPDVNIYHNIISLPGITSANFTYNFEVPISNPSIFLPGNHNYTLELFTMYFGSPINGKDFYGKKIAILDSNAIIGSGNPYILENSNFGIGPKSLPNPYSGTARRLEIFNPTFGSNVFNISIKEINWYPGTTNIREHVFVCVSKKELVTDKNQDCIFVHRGEQVLAGNYFNTPYISPLNTEEYFIHVFCNDSGLSQGERCDVAPGNDEKRYANVTFNISYAYPVRIESNFTINVSHRDTSCGDGMPTMGIEQCEAVVAAPLWLRDWGAADAMCSASEPTSICSRADCRCTGAMSFNFGDVNWMNSDNGIISEATIDSFIQMSALAASPENLVNEFTTYPNGDILSFRMYLPGVSTPVSKSLQYASKPTSVAQQPGGAYNIRYYNYSNMTESIQDLLQEDVILREGDKISFNITYQNYTSKATISKSSALLTVRTCTRLVTACDGLSKKECGDACMPRGSYGTTTLNCGSNVEQLTTNTLKCAWNNTNCVASDSYIVESGVVNKYQAKCLYEPESLSACQDGIQSGNVNGKFVAYEQGSGLYEVPHSSDPLNGCNGKCNSFSITQPCGRELAYLPFISIWQLILASLFIVITYFIRFRRK